MDTVRRRVIPRAFYRYYGVTPSAARSRKCVLASFERISVESLLKGELNDNRGADGPAMLPPSMNAC